MTTLLDSILSDDKYVTTARYMAENILSSMKNGNITEAEALQLLDNITDLTVIKTNIEDHTRKVHIQKMMTLIKEIMIPVIKKL